MPDNYSLVETEKILVFPSARRMNKQVSARLTTEQAFANLINKLIETSGFVITPEIEDPNDADYYKGFHDTEPFEFNVYGYYFKVAAASDILSNFNDGQDKIYANIYLDTTSDNNYTELISTDSTIDNVLYYTGVQFSEDDMSLNNPSSRSLLLFEKVTYAGQTFWTVPIESRLKFVYTFALGVDGGEIFSKYTTS